MIKKVLLSSVIVITMALESTNALITATTAPIVDSSLPTLTPSGTVTYWPTVPATPVPVDWELSGPSHVIAGQEFDIQIIVKPHGNPVISASATIFYDVKNSLAFRLVGIKSETPDYLPGFIYLESGVVSYGTALISAESQPATKNFVLATITFLAGDSMPSGTISFGSQTRVDSSNGPLYIKIPGGQTDGLANGLEISIDRSLTSGTQQKIDYGG